MNSNSPPQAISVWIEKLSWLTGPVAALILAAVGYRLELEWSIIGTVCITVWVALWWMMEPISIPATSLIPLTLFPLLGILKPEDVAAAYGNPMIFLMLGGFLLSRGIECSGVHRRLALSMVQTLGRGSQRGTIWGFLIASASLSMWISNAATSLMLLPIAMAVVTPSKSSVFRKSVLLAVAYGASLGGINTPIGTPPNLIFIENYRELTGVDIGFAQWFSWIWPIGIGILVFAGYWLSRGLDATARFRLPPVGPWTSHELRALSIFAVTVTLWITRTQPWGGWKTWLSLPQANDGNVALIGALLMLMVPSGMRRREAVLTWDAAREIPWGILILFAGGIAIAKAFAVTGLSELLGQQVASLNSLPVWVLVLVICVAVTFLTEITSNTATATILMPILAAASVETGFDPLLLMIPATISASFAFMLPVATPPNAIVFGANELQVRDMASRGFLLNMVGAIWITAMVLLLLWDK